MARTAGLLAVSALLLAMSAAEGQQLSPVERYRLRRRAETALEQRQFADAAAMLKRLAETDAWDGQLWLGYAQASRGLGNTAEAVEGLKKALALGAGYRPDMAYQIARGYATLGRKDSAYAWLDQAFAWQASPRTRLQTDSAFVAFRDEDRFRELAAMPPRRNLSRDERWRYDLNFLASEARRLHASIQREAFSPEFDAAIKEISDRIPRLSDHQIVVEFQRLIVLLRDGHSVVTLPPSSKMLPVDFYAFSDGLFIVGDLDSTRRLVGAKVERFGARATDSVMAGLVRYVSRDNPMGLKWIGPQFLAMVDFVQALGGTDNPDRVTLTVREPGGAARQVTLEGGAPRRLWYSFKLPPPKDRPGETPLWLKNVPTPYWFTAVPDANAVYFQFNQVREARDESIVAFEAKLREALTNPAVKNLIVDVRHNSGGNSYLYPPLLRAMSWFEESAPDHRIYYLAGRNTFSAAQNFSTNVERLTRAVFVGEPTGASPNFTGEGPNLFELPYSKVKASISNWYHQFSFWSDTRLWIAPDIPVELSSADYFTNRDPALDAVKEVIRRSRGAIP